MSTRINTSVNIQASRDVDIDVDVDLDLKKKKMYWASLTWADNCPFGVLAVNGYTNDHSSLMIVRPLTFIIVGSSS